MTGIHLILGTQRPDKKILGMQSKDNLQTRICFSVPSVAASTLVVGDMTASTLGNHPGRAVYQMASTKIVQVPLIENDKISELVTEIVEKQKQKNDLRTIHEVVKIEAEKPEVKGRLL